MLAVIITLTPAHWNELTDCQKAESSIAGLLIVDVKISWNSTLVVLKRAYRLWEFTCMWLENP